VIASDCSHNPKVNILWVNSGASTRGIWTGYPEMVKMLIKKFPNLYLSFGPELVMGKVMGISREDCLKLAEELHDWDDPDGREWSVNLRPLVEVIVASYLDYFPKQTYPNRSGVHSSTAFGLSFALDYARAVKHEKLEALVVERSRSYFGADERIPAAWEPDGADFFSPSLMEADLMRRVLPAEAFRGWFHRFLPDLNAGVPSSILEPATVTDRTDPQLVHLDGLNLSRAWCLRSVATMFPAGDATRQTLLAAAERHAAAGLPHVTSGDYAGEHWLASFATWLLTEGE
jgi:hypothetical protein